MSALLKTIALCTLAGTLMAQRPGPRAANATPPDPATVAQREVTRLTTRLTLTPAQAAQALTIFTSSLTAAAPIETTLRGDRKTLHDAITGNTPAVIDQVSANIGVLNGQIMAIQSKADAAFYAILDSTQQTKFSKRGGPRGRGGRAH